jgi:hypothetical protein
MQILFPDTKNSPYEAREFEVNSITEKGLELYGEITQGKC